MFERADLLAHNDELLAVHLEYLDWMCERFETLHGLSLTELIGAPLPTIADHMVRGLADGGPHGAFYLLKVGDRAAGVGGLRDVGDGAAEMARIFVRPEFRGAKLGEALVGRLIEDARRGLRTGVAAQRRFHDFGPAHL
jgi:GNAT superfamily N-acetyltransferase